MDDGDDSPPAPRSTVRADRRCVYCGTAIETGDWYPVTKERDDDGSLRFYAFCSEECQTAWLEGRPE